VSRLKRGLHKRWRIDNLWQHGGRFFAALHKAGILLRPLKRSDFKNLEDVLSAFPTEERKVLP